MKNLLIALSMIVSSFVPYSSFAADPDLSGVEHLKNFVGDYEVTECSVCDDQPLSDNFKVKDLKEFSVIARSIAPIDLPRGAQIDQQISFMEVFKKSGGLMRLFHDVGLQFMNLETMKSVLNVSENVLVYVSLKNGVTHSFHIEKVDDYFVITHKTALQEPTHYDNFTPYSYTVKAKKIN